MSDEHTIRDWHGDTLRVFYEGGDLHTSYGTVVIIDGSGDEGESSVDVNVGALDGLILFLEECRLRYEKECAERELDKLPEGFVVGATVTHRHSTEDRGLLLQRRIRYLGTPGAYAVWLVGWEKTGRINDRLEDQMVPRVGWHAEESLRLA